MARLQLQAASFAYEGRAPLFSIDSLVVDPGIVGLVGENGAGKSTLLKMLADELAPTSGRITRVPEDATLVAVSQLSALTASVRALANWELPDAGLWLSRFAVDPALVDRFDTASAGERRRLVLAAAFAEAPNILLLDEPGSHVDARVQTCLRDALADFRGVCVLVSHDASLLDAVTTRTLWLEEETLFDVPGNFTLAKLERERRLDRRRTKRDALVTERDHRGRELADARRARDSATANRSTKAKNVHDHDARESGKKVLAEHAEKSLGRRVHVKRGAVERLDEKIDLAAFIDDRQRAIRFPYRRPKERRLASVMLSELNAGTTLLGRNVSFVIDRDTRARISGPNGAGKSTLLRAIHAECKNHVYLPQELSTEDTLALFEATRALAPAERGQVLAAFACLGGAPESLSAFASPGEARKLAIAHGLGSGTPLLVLDEPMNHLDLVSQQRLESALEAYEGALVLVSHDAGLGAKACKTEWAFVDRSLVPI